MKNLVWIAVIVAIVGGVVLLSRIDPTKKLTKTEKVIPENALAR
jgi:hypothetical protein